MQTSYVALLLLAVQTKTLDRPSRLVVTTIIDEPLIFPTPRIDQLSGKGFLKRKGGEMSQAPV
jgi:hypothetical protein